MMWDPDLIQGRKLYYRINPNILKSGYTVDAQNAT